MARATLPFPSDHNLAMNRVLCVVDIIASEPTIDDNAVVSRLVSEGVETVDAELLIRFVPCAMAFGLLKQCGVAKFPSTYSLRTSAGRWVELPLVGEHYFTAALQLGFEIVTQGYTGRVSREVFQAVVTRSAEMNAANKAIESEGRSALAGATIGPPALIGITPEQVAASRPQHNFKRPWWRFWG